MTLILYAIIMVIAITVGELGKTFNIVGAVASNSIGFILPALFYMMLVIKKKKPRKITFYSSIVMFSLAIPFGVLAIVC
jgi:amino acid permease